MTTHAMTTKPIRIPPPQPLRRHSDEVTFSSPLPRSPRRAFSYAPPRPVTWTSFSDSEEQEEDNGQDVLAEEGHSSEENKENEALQFFDAKQPSSKSSASPFHSPRIASPSFGAEEDEEESLYATFASLHDTVGNGKRRISSQFDMTPLDEEQRGRQLSLPRSNSALSSSGWTSRSTSRGSSVREMSPDDWTRRMIRQTKVEASVEVQQQSACSPPHSGSPLDRTSSPTLSQSAPANSRRGHRKSSSTASESLTSHSRPSPSPLFSRRHSDQSSSASPTASTEHSASQTSLARHLHSADSTPPSPGSPVTPSDDNSKNGRSSPRLNHFVDGMASLRHSVSLVGSSLRRASHLGVSGSTAPTPVAWSEVSAIKVRFRVKQESSEGVNSFLLGLRDMETGGGSRLWDPRESEEGRQRGRRASGWPTISSTYGEPASVEVIFANGARKTFSPEGLQPAEIMRAVLLPPP